MNSETEQISRAIASYQEAVIAFDEATAKTQASLEACGWKWVERDISDYSDGTRCEYLLVSPKMFEALDLCECDEEGDIPMIREEPNYINWSKMTDYLVFKE